MCPSCPHETPHTSLRGRTETDRCCSKRPAHPLDLDFLGMNVEGAQLRTAWREVTPIAEARYTLCSSYGPWLVGCSSAGWPALLRRISNKPPESVRTMGAIQLRFIVGAELAIAGATESGNFAVLE